MTVRRLSRHALRQSAGRGDYRQQVAHHDPFSAGSVAPAVSVLSTFRARSSLGRTGGSVLALGGPAEIHSRCRFWLPGLRQQRADFAVEREAAPVGQPANRVAVRRRRPSPLLGRRYEAAQRQRHLADFARQRDDLALLRGDLEASRYARRLPRRPCCRAAGRSRSPGCRAARSAPPCARNAFSASSAFDPAGDGTG